MRVGILTLLMATTLVAISRSELDYTTVQKMEGYGFGVGSQHENLSDSTCFCSSLSSTTCPSTDNQDWGISCSDLLPFNSSDLSLSGARVQPNVRRNWSLVGAYGYETFRGVADQGWQNDGLYAGLNLGTRLGSFGEYTGIGFQVGASWGLYDWEGNPYRPDAERRLRQDFATYGLFRRATEQAPFTFAVAQDWMFTDNATAYGLSLGLSQIRCRLGYVTNAANEFGVVGTFRVLDDTSLGRSSSAVASPDRIVRTRPLNHVSVYWHHKWSNGGANTVISLGMPEKDRVSEDGSLGDFLATATANIPFSDKVGLFGQVMYMNPTASPGTNGSHEDTWSFTLGIEIYPGRDARSTTIAGERWMALLPVANNGNFLIDGWWWPR